MLRQDPPPKVGEEMWLEPQLLKRWRQECFLYLGVRDLTGQHSEILWKTSLLRGNAGVTGETLFRGHCLSAAISVFRDFSLRSKQYIFTRKCKTSLGLCFVSNFWPCLSLDLILLKINRLISFFLFS